MPLFRWIGDLGGPRAPGTYEVRHRVVRVTQQDIAAAEKYLRRHPSEDAIFVAEPERPDVYALGSITGTGARRQISAQARNGPTAQRRQSAH